MSKITTVAKLGRKTAAFKQLRFLHWLMATCFLTLYIVGAFMSRLSDDVSFKDYLFDFHKSIGTLAMALLIARIFVLLCMFWSKYSRRQPKLTRSWVKTFALHTALYLFMLVAPISGFFYSNSGDYDVAFFGIVLPRMFGVNQAVFGFARSLHFWLVYTFLAFIVLHTLEQWKFVRSTWKRVFGAILW